MGLGLGVVVERLGLGLGTVVELNIILQLFTSFWKYTVKGLQYIRADMKTYISFMHYPHSCISYMAVTLVLDIPRRNSVKGWRIIFGLA